MQPAGSLPKAFDISRYDVRFKMEPIPQYSAGLGLVTATLRNGYTIVTDSEARVSAALMVYPRLAMARFRTWFMASPDAETVLDWNLALKVSSFRKLVLP